MADDPTHPLLDENYLLGCWLEKQKGEDGKINVDVARFDAVREGIQIARNVALAILAEIKKRDDEQYWKDELNKR